MADYLSRSFSPEEKALLSNTDLGNLNPLQKEVLSVVKTELEADIAAAPKLEHVVGDRKLIRYMRRTKFDLRKTCTLFREMLAWRQEYGTDEIYEKLSKMETLDASQFPHAEKIQPFYPILFTSNLSRDGHPLLIELLGKLDPAALMQAVTLDELLAFHVHCVEAIALILDRKAIEKEELTRVIMTVDLKGLGVGLIMQNTRWYSWLGAILKITQGNYPDMSAKILIVNTPYAFYSLWSIISRWMPEQTLAKVCLVDTNFTETLHAAIAPENLPACLGGAHAYPIIGFRLEDVDVKDSENAEEVNIAAGRKQELAIPIVLPPAVEVAGEAEANDAATSQIKWKFKTEGAGLDIGCRMRFQPGSVDSDRSSSSSGVLLQSVGESIEVKAAGRHTDASGSFEVSSSGVLTIEWDNSFSYMRAKKVWFAHGV
mmetsp:Transcript_43064/g.58807  ORF Transcript_43064/g.58807 Transcript_43064/m.58807 type:complete len:429 (-) Transcript_43064:77-1363(-)|eukprot:CAMPEP_0185753758 /NCGR_PEP_ID=MMETSP1174-20130828/12465_1 /TAXON_ID=35687 /ORGANISM="Dictyocha speculum, Strain CCMP1381" /LENGTH=428 /DNA_ID=CAMNT_0028431741 /DNA_START=32 /DNA_END=1318 /DNA_ORIENTATION=-